MEKIWTPPKTHTIDLTRRRLLIGAAAFIPSLIVPGRAIAQSADFWNLPRELWLYRPASKETVREVYWYDGRINWPGYVRICNLLRDVRANEAAQMDVVTLDILRGMQGWLQGFGISEPLIMLSGYRTARTNATTEGAAKDSQHTRGKATDQTIRGVSSEALGKFGMWLGGGGVGFYQKKNFVHTDSGRIRTWRG